MDLCGKTVLERVVERCLEAEFPSKVVVATPHEIPLKLPVDYFYGDEFDVVKRYYDCCKKYDADIVVRVTSDCPLIEPSLIDECIFWLIDGKYDYVAAIEPHYPDGLDTEVFTNKMLEKANLLGKGEEREHLVKFFTKQPNIKLLTYGGYDLPKVSVDTMDDLERVRRIWTERQYS